MEKYIDKLLHLLVGFALGNLFLFTGYWSLLIVTGIGIGKELYDKYYKKTKFDMADLACTVAGGFAAIWLNLVYGGIR